MDLAVRDPLVGIGKPEPLASKLSGYCKLSASISTSKLSRQISAKK